MPLSEPVIYLVLGLIADSYYFIAEGLITVIWITYVWICKAPFHVIQQLQEEATVDSDSNEFNEAKALLNSRLPTVLAGAITLIMAFPLAYQMSVTPPIWFNANIYGIGLRLVAALPSIFAAFSALLRFTVNTGAFWRLFNTLVLHPLHPDRVCGLRPFGRYAVKSTYPLIMGGVVAGYLEYWSFSHGEGSIAIFAHLGMILYLLITPIVFFVPLLVAHSAMLHAKEKLILPLSKQSYNDREIIWAALGGSPGSFKKGAEKLHELKNLYELTQSIPTWPVDWGHGYHFAGFSLLYSRQ
jgi:hypothetical protein